MASVGMTKLIMKQILLAVGIVAIAIPSVVSVASEMLPATVASPMTGTIYASAPGKATLDQGEGGGNPFASALIEILERPSLNTMELVSAIKETTFRKSLGFQNPDDTAINGKNEWKIKPLDTGSHRVALVATYSSYKTELVTQLPGAERDRLRVTDALRAAGFEVVSLPNPSKKQLRIALEGLSSRSRGADAAIIYVTGHGFEVDGDTYLAPSDFSFQKESKEELASAINVDTLGAGLQSRYINLVFFGGCRTRFQ